MSDPFEHVEQDKQRPPGGEELPTYEDLAQQHGPNSRFGRWRSWIEKRAAERYNDITPEERQRRRERGWDLQPKPVPLLSYSALPRIVTDPPQNPGPPELHIQTLSLQDNTLLGPEQVGSAAASPSPPPFISSRINPSHLRLNHFGSRFLPHSTTQIRCILPLNSERLLLIGHDEGLSVLDLFPREWSDAGGIDVKNPDEAQTRLVWEGEGVFQMTIIEQGEAFDGKTAQGVVLALVGPEPGSPGSKDGDAARSLRMYNLMSLTNLAKWAIAQRGARPLDLRRPPNWQVQTTPSKKHRHQGSIARGLKSLIDNPTPYATLEQQRPVSYQNMLTPTISNGSPERRTNAPPLNLQQTPTLTPSRRNTDDSTWDVIDDIPLRWATDFVPLATPNSRLAGSTVISYAIWQDENRIGRGGQLLAVATRSNILLYEVPKGERAFRFVKEFYTPMQPRNITFFQQSVQEVTRSMSDVTGGGNTSSWHKRTDSANTIRDNFSRSPPSGLSGHLINYGPQLSLFVVFDKKAGWIRIADSAVGEMELPDDSSRLSFEHTSPPKWVLPVRCELPVPGPSTSVSGAMPVETTRKVIFLTRGRKTHILPSPLPTNYATYPSLAIITWKSPPRHVTPRVCEPDDSDEAQDLPPFLQLVAFGEDGIEVQEMSLNFISRGKGKGKATFEEVVRAEDDVIGECGFLATGGHWDQISRLIDPSRMTRTNSTSSDMSSASFDSVGTSVIVSQLKRQEGIYGWWKKGVGDFRVFWVGGSPGPYSDN
ncbi:hypothetical protein AN958_05654 [Leucoagaricus sp. SymC.cos]|nr:hypothetical protein AN958_05654 [Leucoagaricus sp. SymC.cos]